MRWVDCQGDGYLIERIMFLKGNFFNFFLVLMFLLPLAGSGCIFGDDDKDEERERLQQQIIANKMFNMGRPRLSKFKGMKAGVDARDWNKAADEMVDSRWYDQVTNRAKRLVARMRALS